MANQPGPHAPYAFAGMFVVIHSTTSGQEVLRTHHCSGSSPLFHLQPSPWNPSPGSSLQGALGPSN